jgi:hypothetical protein
MSLSAITYAFAYIRDKLPHLDERTRSHNLEASYAIADGFVEYGWSFSELLDTNTKVMVILKPYLQRERPHAGGGPEDSESANKRRKRPHAGGGPEDSESTNKRRRVDRPRASTSRPDHDFPAALLDQFSPGSIDQTTSSGIDNTMESMPRSNSSHLISFDAGNGTRDLTDPAAASTFGYTVNSQEEFTDPSTASILGYAVNNQEEFTGPATASTLGYAVNSQEEFTDPATASILGYTVNSQEEFTDPATASILGYTVNSQDEFTDPATASILGYTVNGQEEFTGPITASSLSYTISCDITDLDTADFLHTHDQSMNALSNLDYEIDPSVVEHLRWTVDGSDALTDQSTERFLRGTTSPNQVYLMGNFIHQSHDQHLPNATRLY